MTFTKLFFATIFVLVPSITPAYAERPAFNISVTQSCLEAAGAENRSSCIGASASACMETQSGGSTVGMGFCLDEELTWWDQELNFAYSEFLNIEKRADLEAKREGYSQPERVRPLKEMQRKWIGYRDALCDHEAAQWGGGTGASPAYLDCLMRETGRQTMVLQSRMKAYAGR